MTQTRSFFSLSFTALLLATLMGCDSPPPPTAKSTTGTRSPDAATPPLATTDKPATYLERPLMDEVIYFVMTDRFANGNTENDQGGPKDSLTNGCFDPKDPRAFHGGDLKGLREHLDYLQDLGVTALWLTPVIANRARQVGSCGYHGYWGLDFLNVDPHLGTNDDFKRLLTEAHARNIKVFLDMVANHTADIISYAGNPEGYRPLDKSPYKPVVEPQWAQAKNPDWLNNPAYYNNRGDSTFAGESAIYGDFHGLDDLDTRQQFVIDGVIDIFKHWVREYQVDGFRLDTVKHVDIGLWQRLVPSIRAYAEKQGLSHFALFGEIFDHQPDLVSHYTTEGKLPSALDFPLQGVLRDVFSRGGETRSLSKIYEDDDYYLNATQDARQLVTFSGNHDKGRFGFFLQEDGVPENQWLSRSQLVNAFLMFSRGVPSIYYGDEQGFTGNGGDSDARQDMFASQVDSYQNEPRIGGGSGKNASYDPQHPLYQQLKRLIALRQNNLALRQGLQLPIYSQDQAGIFAFSRISPQESREYLAVFNNATTAQQVTLTSLTANSSYKSLLNPEQPALHSNAQSQLQINLPALSYQVYRAEGLTALTGQIKDLKLLSPQTDARVRGRVELSAQIQATGPVEAEFAVKIGDGSYQVVGRDWTAPYRVFWDSSALNSVTPIKIRVRSLDNNGIERSAERSALFDPRVLEQLNLHYENPYQANRLMVLSDKGALRGAYELNQENRIGLNPDDEQLQLVYGRYQQNELVLEPPLSLSIEQLLASLNTSATTAGLNLYINKEREIATNPNFYTDRVANPELAKSSHPLPPLNKALYLRGSMTDWQAIRPMEPTKMACIGSTPYWKKVSKPLSLPMPIGMRKSILAHRSRLRG